MHRWRSLGSVVLAVFVGCGPNLEDTKRPRSVPYLAGFESRLKSIAGEDGQWMRDYLSGQSSLSREIDERQLSGILGRLTHADSPDVVAGLVEKAREHLYVEFFYAFNDAERRALVDALQAMIGDGSVQAERYAAVLGASSVGYPATLDLVLRSLRLAEIAKPSEMLPARVVQVAKASKRPDVLAGAAEVLVAEGWVRFEGGESDRRAAMAAARDLLVDAVRQDAADPALRMAFVLLHLRADISQADLLRLFDAAKRTEPENGAYDYFRAMALAEAGHDEEAVAAVRAGMTRPHVTFHDVQRARFLAAFLDEAGYGPVGAKLAAYNAAPVDGPMGMRRLGQLLRESPLADRGRPSIVAAFPRRLAEQLALRPRLLSTERIRLTLALGSWEFSLGEDPNADGARSVRQEMEALEAGQTLASGPEIWDDMFALLGEEAFMKYVDEVLFGQEAEYLRKCSGQKDLEACVALLQAEQKTE